MTTRRNILGGALGLAALAIAPARAEDKPAEIRIGTQKGGYFPAVRQRRTVEEAFKPLGIEIKWIDFQFGPPLLEAINVGAVDFGFVGDAPPIFAQAGNAKIRYVAAVKSEGTTQAIIVPQDSPIKTLADLKGKRVAFGKGSSAHNLLVAALEKAGLSWSDITPGAARAGRRDRGVRQGFGRRLVDLGSLSGAGRVEGEGPADRVRQGRAQGQRLLHRGLRLRGQIPVRRGTPQRGVRVRRHMGRHAQGRSCQGAGRCDRGRYRGPSSASSIAPTSASCRWTTKSSRPSRIVADRFAKLGLIPKPDKVSEIVWKWNPGS